MIQDINSRVFIVEYISGEIVRLLEEYEVDVEQAQKIWYEVEKKIEESPQRIVLEG